MALYLGMNRELLVVDPERPADATSVLTGKHIAAIATDPHHPGRVYCGTYNEGLWRSDDAGASWRRIGNDATSGIPHTSVQAVAVRPIGEVLHAGTEPSVLYRSDDGGEAWRDLASLRELPSAPTWSFPPRPDTNHVQWITPHPVIPGRLIVAIEAGALVRSDDGGETWEDRRPGSPYDSHTVLIHPDAPERVRSAAGDGYFESENGGDSWTKPRDGLRWGYCWGLAIDAREPDLALMSIAPNARHGHGGRGEPMAEIYRREGNDPWTRVFDGLPEDEGTTLSVLAADPGVSRSFYALNNRGLYATDDGGLTWHRLDVPWKDAYQGRRPAALAVTPSGT